jgi:excisionase family DNA binding protein
MTEKLGASVKEAAEAMGVSTGTIYTMLRKPDCKIPVIKFGDRIVIPWAWIRRVMVEGVTV